MRDRSPGKLKKQIPSGNAKSAKLVSWTPKLFLSIAKHLYVRLKFADERNADADDGQSSLKAN